MIRLAAHIGSSAPWCVVVGCLLASTAGRPEVACAAASDVDQQLQVAIEETRRELRAEADRIELENQARREQLEALRNTSRDLAGELVARKLAIARKQQELAELRRRRERLWGERAGWQEELAELALICGDVHDELARIADTVPVSESRQEQLDMLSGLDEMRRAGASEEMVGLTVDLIGSFLREPRTTAVYEGQVVDPQGRPRETRLLRVGQSLFAYQVPGTGEVAIAIAAPYEQSGFRWQEQLPQPIETLLLKAFEQAGRSNRPVWLPVDVAGQITATTHLQAKGMWDRLRSGGIVMLPLTFVALCLAILIADRFLVLLREGRHSLRFCDRVLALCSHGEFEEAERLAERKKGVLSRTLKACLAHRQSPPEILDDAIQETLLHEFPKLERFLPSIRMLSAVAPMLGLLGTVTGIITTFDVITVAGSGRPRLMAGGISEALITTATGLAIAIPGLLAHSILSGRLDGIIADTERFAATASNLVKQHQHRVANGQDKDHGTLD